MSRNFSKEYVVRCQYCNKEFTIKISDARFNLGKQKKYCSKSCSNYARGSRSEETKQKIRDANIGKKVSIEQIELRKSNGVYIRAAKKRKDTITNDPTWINSMIDVWNNPIRNEKIGKSRKGKIHTDESKEKIRKKLKGKPWSGKHTEEFIRNLIEFNKRTKTGMKRRPESNAKTSATLFRLVDEGKFKGGWWKTGKGRRSYAEEFFEIVFKNLKLTDYIKEYVITKKSLNLIEPGFYQIDFYFPHIKLAVEIDGSQHWLNKELYEKDIIRDNALKLNNYIVYRIPWNNLTTENGKYQMKNKIENFVLFYNNLKNNNYGNT